MKSKSMLLLAVLFIASSCSTVKNYSLSTLLPDSRKLFVVHVHGDWCKTCMEIDSVIHDLAAYWKKRTNVEYLMFDETNPAKLAASATLAKKWGLEDHFEYERHTGELLYIDQETKEILTRFYGVDSYLQYKVATEELLKGNSVASILAQPKQYELSKPSLTKARKAKLLVIDIHHDSCGGCAITAPVFEEVARSYNRDRKVCFMTFDLTNRETVKATRELIEQLGLEDIYNNYKHTGEVLFVKRKTKEVLAKLVLEQDQERYRDLIRRLKKKV